MICSWPRPFHQQERLTKDHFPREVVNRLLSFDSFECAICLEDHVENPSIIIPCGHTFCRDCLEAVLIRAGGKSRCASCRRDFSKITNSQYFAYVFCPEILEIEVLEMVFRALCDGNGVRLLNVEDIVESSDEENESGEDNEPTERQENAFLDPTHHSLIFPTGDMTGNGQYSSRRSDIEAMTIARSRQRSGSDEIQSDSDGSEGDLEGRWQPISVSAEVRGCCGGPLAHDADPVYDDCLADVWMRAWRLVPRLF